MSNETKKYSGFWRWTRRIGWVLIGLLLIGIMLRLSLRTGFVQNWVRGFIVNTANKQLNAQLSINQLSGDLWTDVTMSGIRLMQDDTVAQIDSIHVAYDIWALLGGRIDISKLGIYQPRLHLRQQDDQWNVQNLVKESGESTDSAGGFAFQIDDLQLSDGYISVQSDSLPLESNFAIDELAISSKVEYTDKSFDVNLRNLSFQLENTRLQQPLHLQTSATAQQNRITLEKLVVATGNSMFRSSGYVSSEDSSIQLDFSADPVSWKDVASYVQGFPLRENVELSIGLQGRPEQFELTLRANAQGLEAFKLSSSFQWKSSLVLRQLTARARYINPQALLAETTLPRLRDLKLDFNGAIDMAKYQKGSGDLRFSAREVKQDPYHLDNILGEGSLDGSKANLELKAQQQKQLVTSNIQVDHLWSELPSVHATMRAQNINPAYWMQDTTYTGNLTFQTELTGRGWYPQQRPWQYSLSMSKGQLMGHPITNLSASGKLSADDITTDARLQIREGNVSLIAGLQNMNENPSYNYTLKTRGLNIGPLVGSKEFDTSLNSNISGRGSSFHPSDMQLQTTVSVDSSVVNGELIRNISAGLSVRDSIAVVDSASLKSTIADGGFSLRMNLLRRYDPDNELSFDLNLKDLDALAPLAGVSALQAEGTVEGNLSPIENENLRFLGTLDLSEVKYNDLFSADRAQGSVDIRATQNLEYLTDLDLTNPTFSGVQLQNLTLITQGNYADSTASGRFEFRISSPNEGRIEQAGTYVLKPDSARVRTTNFNIISDYRTLRLERPFELLVHNDSLRMDTMRVSSGDGAYLEMGIPLISQHVQKGFVRGQALNTAVIQSCLLGENYFRGLLSGEFEISRRDTNLNAGGHLVLSEVTYQETSFDSLLINGKIANDRLEGRISLHQQDQELVRGRADLPFKLGNPEQFPPSFFREPISGRIRVRDINIQRFQSFFAKAGLTQTRGIFSFRGRLRGTAGEPEFTAEASLKNAQLSGVSVDSVTAGLNYRHDDAKLELDASVMSLHQKAAQVDARFPLFINMKTFRVDLPEAQDSIAVDITTNNFNLKALNDFIDRLTVRQVAGQLDGRVQVTGTMEDLKTNGQFALKDGAFRLVPAGIRVDNIQSTLKFDPNKVRLTNLSANSGGGNLKASGMVELEKLVPGNIDLKIKANNFRAANTSQYSAVIDMDAQARGSVTKPRITGSLSFERGFLQLQNFGEKSVENIQLDSLNKGDNSVSIYDSLALNMNINFNRRFYIRNERYLEMEIELDGQLDLLKDSGKDLQLFGTISAPSGYARPFGKEFKLQEGTVTFSGPPTNPQLMIRTRYEPPQTQQNIVIWYIIEGTVEKPKFKYESQPTMELENIISYTLFGQPFYALNSWKQVVASSGSNTTAADVALDVLLDRIEALATQKLGIDVVKIDNTPVGSETGTSITTGWYLSPKVFFAIQNVITGSTPDTSFLLEYMLRENLKLILQQGNGIRQGVDVKWNYDY